MRSLLTLSTSLMLALALVVVAGCAEKKPVEKKADMKAGVAGKANDDVVLEFEEIDLMPAMEKKVAVKSGKAEMADAPKDSGLTAKVEGNAVTVSAAKDAKEGMHHIKVKGKGKEAVLMVTVKKEGEPAKEMPAKEEPPKKE